MRRVVMAVMLAAVAFVPAGRAADQQSFEQIARGKYLARVGDCTACHTAAGGQPFAGGKSIETPFGRLVTPNITPDPVTGIGAWTDDDFYRAMHTGIARNGMHLYPAFPYTAFTKVTRKDALAIRAWLATLPPVRHKVQVNTLPFPFDIRASLIAWDALFFKAGTFAPDPKKSGEWIFISAEPMLAADHIDFTGNDFRFKSEAILLLGTNKKLAFGFGLAYHYQFSGSQVLPLIVTVWRISDKVSLSGALPIIPRLEFKLDQHWSIGAGINGNYSSYRLTSFNNQYLQSQIWSFGFTSKYRTASRFEIGGFLGFGSRRVDIYNSNETVPLRIYGWDIGGTKPVPVFEKSFKGLAFNLALAYNLDKRKL